MNGEEKGREFSVPPTGAVVGRVPSNDVVLPDPGLSRHHCRFFFKNGDELWLQDLRSSNGVHVNGATIEQTRLNVGDQVVIGETVLLVLSASLRGRAAGSPVLAGGPAAAEAEAAAEPPAPARPAAPPSRSAGRLALHVLAALAIAAWWIFLLCSLVPGERRPARGPTPAPPAAAPTEAGLPAVPRPRAPNLSGPEAERLRRAASLAADALLRNNPAAALSILDRETRETGSEALRAELQLIRRYIQGLDGMNRMLADAFTSRLSQTVTVRYKGQAILLTPQAIIGTRLRAALPSAGDTNGLLVGLWDLEVPNLSEWLPPPRTEEDCGMQYLLLMRNGDRAGARLLAPRCGPLADAFVERLSAGTEATSRAGVDS